MSGSRDVEVGQRQSVFARNTGGLGGETGLVQYAVENFAGTVAGEHASRTVGAMGARRQSENHDSCNRVAEGGDRPPPIGLVTVGAAFQLRDFRRMPAQAGTTCAGYYLLVNNFQQKGPKW